ncbi:hypothetical protein [Ancylobacter rudongensis]|uniref:Uncharacterized protein n=1 Tax=Ancylobacter rudongensis TaxID=177413 RepID=A0A1G4PSQ4_9HYPH|nr:hypothetical protein [Ancylobacter rudongensis]SCW35138.1 hypothetical protein SAMN05660859_0742 [Ancylobacter rudongensis]
MRGFSGVSYESLWWRRREARETLNFRIGPAEFTEKPGLSLLAPGATKRFAMAIRWLPDVGRLIGAHEAQG